MDLDFSFNPEIFIIEGKNVSRVVSENEPSYLDISSLTSKKVDLHSESYSNPISSGMPIVVLIQATDDYYNIRINDGDDIIYPLTFPPWAINRVEASFYASL